MLEFDPIKHEFSVDDIIIPSVTQILKGCGIIDTFNYSRGDGSAKLRGTLVHQYCEYLDNDELDETSIDEQISPYLEAYKLFKAQTGFKPDMVEKCVYDVFNGYAGILDRTGELNGKYGVLDIKTGSSIPKWGKLQVAAYANCLKDVNASWILLLKPNGTYKFESHSEEELFNNKDIFKACVKVYYYKLNNNLLKEN